MKKTFACTAASLLFVLVISCKKGEVGRSIAATQPNQSIDASVAPGGTFTFVAGTTGSLTVSKQALHFEVSETLKENGSIYYNYQPKAGYFGTDEVTLMYWADPAAPGISGSGCPGSHNTPGSSNAMSTILIKLNVTK